MDSLAIRLDPELLENPDADLRYVLPRVLGERSGGVIGDDGYDYLDPSNEMVIYLTASDLARAVECITDVVENVRVMENHLGKAATVAIQRGEELEVIYPPGGSWKS